MSAPEIEIYKAFPEVQAYGKRSARYVVSHLGRVYRVDRAGKLSLVPPVVRNRSFVVRLNGGRYTKSVPRAVWLAFGGTLEPTSHPFAETVAAYWVLRIDPEAPIDSVTGVQSCAVQHLQWVYAPTLAKIINGSLVDAPIGHTLLAYLPPEGDDS
jgi:hypothetical protein